MNKLILEFNSHLKHLQGYKKIAIVSNRENNLNEIEEIRKLPVKTIWTICYLIKKKQNNTVLIYIFLNKFNVIIVIRKKERRNVY